MKTDNIKRNVFQIVSIVFIVIAMAMFGINGYMQVAGEGNILTVKEAKSLKNVDCILVLGAGVTKDGSPTDMLRDRLLTGVKLYENAVSPKMIMSGDHGKKDYDEVNTMKSFATDKGVASQDVFMDHAGFSTYESLYRAKEIFGAKKIVIVTQQYHMYRALYLAKKLGIEAYGVTADLEKYRGQSYCELREILARNKDFVVGIIKPKPTYLGEAILVSGNGDVTND